MKKSRNQLSSPLQSIDLHKQRWAILSISSIPLVMTLGNSMLIPVLPEMEKIMNISPFQ